MAAIIAQMNRAKWERKKNKAQHIPSNKSDFYIPPFDDGPFIPEKHNKYLRDHKNYLEKAQYEKELRSKVRVILDRKLGYSSSVRHDDDSVYNNSIETMSPKRRIEKEQRDAVMANAEFWRRFITSILGFIAWGSLVVIFVYILSRAYQL